MNEQTAAARALAFLHETATMVAGKAKPIDAGMVVRSDALPAVWSLNHVIVTEPIDYARALAVAEEHLHDLPYRHLLVEHEPSGQRLEQQLRLDGWETEREVVMALVRASDRIVDASAVVEAGEDDALGLMRRWDDEDMERNETAEAREQVLEYNRLGWRARSALRFGMLDEHGELAAITLLFSDGRTAQVEDVYTVPECRGRGFARTLVTHATELARGGGHEFAFILADDNGWPKQLYARLGFEPVARRWIFHRKSSG